MATKASNHLDIALTQAAEAPQAAALVQQANSIVIRDKASHERCREFLKGAKALKKKIVDHYAAIKAPLNAARQTVLDMEKRDVTPIDLAIMTADRIDVAYTNEQRRIEQAAADELRRQAEADEQARRDAEAEKAEAEALKLEASSNVLSEREQIVVARVVHRLMGVGGVVGPDGWLVACKAAGYKDPAAAAKKLITSEKIGAAVDAQIRAARIRQESEAKQAAPINVDVVAPASQVVGGGMRTYYSCGRVDVVALAKAVVAGTVLPEALLPNEPFLNTQAKALKELFPKAYPGCELAKRDGTVAR